MQLFVKLWLAANWEVGTWSEDCPLLKTVGAGPIGAITVMPYSPVKVGQHFGGTYCFHIQGRRVIKQVAETVTVRSSKFPVSVFDLTSGHGDSRWGLSGFFPVLPWKWGISVFWKIVELLPNYTALHPHIMLHLLRKRNIFPSQAVEADGVMRCWGSHCLDTIGSDDGRFSALRAGRALRPEMSYGSYFCIILHERDF
jgi:hypothetical protein